MTLKIAHYISIFSKISETFVYDLINNLESKKISKNYIFTQKRLNHISRPFPSIISVKPSFARRLFNRVFRDWHCPNSRLVLNSLNSISPSIIHSHFGPNHIQIAQVIQSYKLNIPVVFSCHGSDVTSLPDKDANYKHLLEIAFSQNNSLITVPSLFLKAELLRRFTSVPESKIITVKNSVPTTAFPKSHPIKKVDIVSAGRLIPLKGHSFLIKAISVPPLSNLNVNLQIYGDGPELCNLKNLTNKLKLKEKVSFHGFIEHDILLSRIREARVFVYPSIPDPNTKQQESFGLAILESLFYDTKVITTNVGGIPEILLNGDNICAKVISHSSEYELSKAIYQALTTPPPLPCEFDKYRQAYDYNLYLQRYKSIYDSLLQSRVK